MYENLENTTRNVMHTVPNENYVDHMIIANEAKESYSSDIEDTFCIGTDFFKLTNCECEAKEPSLDVVEDGVAEQKNPYQSTAYVDQTFESPTKRKKTDQTSINLEEEFSSVDLSPFSLRYMQ